MKVFLLKPSAFGRNVQDKQAIAHLISIASRSGCLTPLPQSYFNELEIGVSEV